MVVEDHRPVPVGAVVYPEGADPHWEEEEVRFQDDDADGEPHRV